MYTPSLYQLISAPERIDSITVHYDDVMKKGTFIKGNIVELTRKTVRPQIEAFCFGLKKPVKGL